MPEMDGISFLKCLNEKKLEYPIVVSSGDTQASLMSQCVMLGTLAFLPKPVSNKRLSEIISNSMNLFEMKNQKIDLIFSERELSYLKKLLEESLYNGTKKMGELIGHDLRLSIPHIKLGQVQDVKLFNKKDGPNILGAVSKFFGNYAGEGFLFLEEKGAKELLFKLSNEIGDSSKEDVFLDLFKEMTNIIITSTLGIFSNKLSSNINIKAPVLIQDNYLKKKFKGDEKIILIESEIRFNEFDLDGNVVILLDFDSLIHLKAALGYLIADLF